MEKLSGDKLHSKLESVDSIKELKDLAKKVLSDQEYDAIKNSPKYKGKTDQEKKLYFKKKLEKAINLKNSKKESSEDVVESKAPEPVKPKRTVSKTKTGAIKAEPLEQSSLSSRQKKMFDALNKLNLRGPQGKIDLYTIMKRYNIKGRTSAKMNKTEKILAIIAAAEELGLKLENLMSEEEIPSSPKPVSSKPSSPKKEIPAGKECGGMPYDKLLKQSLGDLKKMLESNGIRDASEVRTKEHAASLICDAEKGKICSEDYSCGKGRVCDITTKPGVCVKQPDEESKMDVFNYLGRTIIGSKSAISKLQKQLEASKPASPKPSKPEPKPSKPEPKPESDEPESEAPPPKQPASNLTYEELLNKRLEELKAILESKGVQNTSKVNSKEHAAFLADQVSKGGVCSEENKCGKGLICDVTTKPGVCVDKKIIADNYVEPISLNGVKVVGTPRVLSKLQKKYQAVQPEEQVEVQSESKKALIKKASMIIGREKSFFKSMSEEQLTNLIDGYGIVEDSSNMKNFISKKTSVKLSKLSKLPLEELIKRASLITDEILEDAENDRANREDMIELLSGWSNKPPSDYKKVGNNAIKEKLRIIRLIRENPPTQIVQEDPRPSKSFQDLRKEAESVESKAPPKPSKPSKKPVPKPESEDEESEEAIPPPKPSKPSKKPLPKPDSEDEQSEEAIPPPKPSKPSKKPIKEDSDDEESEEESKAPPKGSKASKDAKASKEIKKEDLERVMEQILAGDKQNIDDLSAVQNTVLKCFGLLGA